MFCHVRKCDSNRQNTEYPKASLNGWFRKSWSYTEIKSFINSSMKKWCQNHQNAKCRDIPLYGGLVHKRFTFLINNDPARVEMVKK